MSDLVLKAEKLTKKFTQGKTTLEIFTDINLELRDKESLAIIGESGAGKSTLMHLLGGLDKPTTGNVWVMDENLTQLSPAKQGELRNRYMGFVYQFHHLLPEFNALENVAMPLILRGETTALINEKANYYLDKVGLSNRAKHRVGELSGGERQRIAIARALITEPRCVLADEPTGNLDERTAQSVADLMFSLNEKLGTSFIIVTHNIQLAKRLNRILNLEGGQLSAVEL